MRRVGLLLAGAELCAPALAQVPRGFRRLESKVAGLSFCYPLGWKQAPLTPTGKIARAKYLRPRRPRELRFLGKRYRGREPYIFVFLVDATKPPVNRLREIEAGRKKAVAEVLDGVDVAALEAEWKRFVTALKVPASMRRRN